MSARCDFIKIYVIFFFKFALIYKIYFFHIHLLDHKNRLFRHYGKIMLSSCF